MKINERVLSILAISFYIITIFLGVVSFFNNYVSANVVMLFLGLGQLFSGLRQIDTKQQTNSKLGIKDNKMLGVFSVILGIVIIIGFVIKMIGI